MTEHGRVTSCPSWLSTIPMRDNERGWNGCFVASRAAVYDPHEG